MVGGIVRWRHVQNLALVRPPPPNFADGLITHLPSPTNTDFDVAVDQWEGYCGVFKKHEGWDLKVLGEARVSLNGNHCPDSVFVEDTAVLFKDDVVGEDVAVICSNMAEIRRPEAKSMEDAIVGTGAFRVERIDGEGEILDGGDVLKVPGGNRVYVGLSSRSNEAGVERLQSILPNHDVRGVPTTKVLHLKSCVTALPDGTIIGYEPLVDDSGFFEEGYLGLPEEGGAHVVILDDKTLLMAASAPKSAEILAKRGYNIEMVDISQFEKLEGCVTCLSVRWRK